MRKTDYSREWRGDAVNILDSFKYIIGYTNIQTPNALVAEVHSRILTLVRDAT